MENYEVYVNRMITLPRSFTTNNNFVLTLYTRYPCYVHSQSDWVYAQRKLHGWETYIFVYTCTPIPVYLGKLQICTIKNCMRGSYTYSFFWQVFVYRKSVFPTIIRKRNLACFSLIIEFIFRKMASSILYDLTRHLKRLEFKILSVSDIIK